MAMLMSKLKVMVEKSRNLMINKSAQFLMPRYQSQMKSLSSLNKLDAHNRLANYKNLFYSLNQLQDPKATPMGNKPDAFIDYRFVHLNKGLTFSRLPLFQNKKRFFHSAKVDFSSDEMNTANKIIEECLVKEDFYKLDELNKVSVEVLLLAGLDHKKKLNDFTKSGHLPLHMVMKRQSHNYYYYSKNLETLGVLLGNYFCDPNKKNKKGETALFIPVQLECYLVNEIYEIVKILIKHQANSNIVNDDGQTPAHVYFNALDNAPFGRDSNIEKVIRLLFKNMRLSKHNLADSGIHSLNINHVDKEGWSLLHLAVYKQREEFVSYLLEEGANPNLGTLNGLTPFDLAVFRRNEKICKLLKKFGGNEPEKYKYELAKQNDYDHITEKYKPTFFSNIITKIHKSGKFKYWHYFGPYYSHYSGPWDQETGLFLPQNKDHSLRFYLCNSDKLRRECYDIVNGINTEVALRSIYWPEKEEGDSQLYLTPMGKAILQKDLKKVEKLIQEGWNAFIENDFIRGTAYFNKYYYEESSWYRMVKCANVKGYAACILESIKTVPTEFNNHSARECDESFAQSVLKMLCDSEHSGINLVNEFYNSIHFFERNGDVNDQYAYFLLRNGLTPKTFLDQTGLSMTEFLESEFDSVQQDDRPPFYYDGHYKINELIRFIATIDNKHTNNSSELTEAIKRVKPK